MKYLVILMMVMSVAACKEDGAKKTSRSTSEFSVIEEHVGFQMFRYENEEVVCYQYFEALQCQFKTNVKNDLKQTLEFLRESN